MLIEDEGFEAVFIGSEQDFQNSWESREKMPTVYFLQMNT